MSEFEAGLEETWSRKEQTSGAADEDEGIAVLQQAQAAAKKPLLSELSATACPIA